MADCDPLYPDTMTTIVSIRGLGPVQRGVKAKCRPKYENRSSGYLVPGKEPHSMAEPPLVVVAAVYFKKADQYPEPANDEKGVPESFSIIIRKATTSLPADATPLLGGKKKVERKRPNTLPSNCSLKKRPKMNYVAASIFWSSTRK